MTETYTLPESRWCAYAQEGITDPDDRTRYMVAYVVEGEPGYNATTFVGTLEYCERVAESINASRGVTPERARDIVASSMAAQNHG